MTFKVEVTIKHEVDGLSTDISCIGSGCQHEERHALLITHLVKELIQLTGSKEKSSPTVIHNGDNHVH